MADKVNIENIYLGSDTQVKCCTTFYELLMAGFEVTPEMILARIMGENLHAYDGLNLDEELPDDAMKYRILQKQIMKPMFKLLDAEVGDEIERRHIGNHHYAYIYHGADKDPLREMRLSAVKKGIDDFREFCIASSGFFPQSWFDYFFRNTSELMKVNTARENGEECMMVSVDRKHQNIDLLPLLYEKIKSKTVIEFDYCHDYCEEPEHRTVHPHFLHEYNGRWHLFGYEKDGKHNPAIIALDRITKDGVRDANKKYVEAKAGFYKAHFEKMVGVTPELVGEELEWDNTKPHAVRLRAYGEYMYGLFKTKPIHCSQTPEGEYDAEKGYGDFTLNVILNNEFIGNILHFGSALEIVEPKEFREVFAKRTKELADRYK